VLVKRAYLGHTGVAEPCMESRLRVGPVHRRKFRVLTVMDTRECLAIEVGRPHGLPERGRRVNSQDRSRLAAIWETPVAFSKRATPRSFPRLLAADKRKHLGQHQRVGRKDTLARLAISMIFGRAARPIYSPVDKIVDGQNLKFPSSSTARLSNLLILKAHQKGFWGKNLGPEPGFVTY
jgi:hypothetical protein